LKQTTIDYHKFVFIYYRKLRKLINNGSKKKKTLCLMKLWYLSRKRLLHSQDRFFKYKTIYVMRVYGAFWFSLTLFIAPLLYLNRFFVRLSVPYFIAVSPRVLNICMLAQNYVSLNITAGISDPRLENPEIRSWIWLSKIDFLDVFAPIFSHNLDWT
jgi:hypothetical protein